MGSRVVHGSLPVRFTVSMPATVYAYVTTPQLAYAATDICMYVCIQLCVPTHVYTCMPPVSPSHFQKGGMYVWAVLQMCTLGTTPISPPALLRVIVCMYISVILFGVVDHAFAVA